MDPSLPGWRTLHPGTTGGKKKRRMRERAWINDGGLCQLCAEPVPYVLATADRILPGALGGAYHQGNLWTACWPCNQRKADGIVPRFAFASRDRLIELGLVST
jgi:5-methylcytosine-specific restriction endonuclease McrA